MGRTSNHKSPMRLVIGWSIGVLVILYFAIGIWAWFDERGVTGVISDIWMSFKCGSESAKMSDECQGY